MLFCLVPCYSEGHIGAGNQTNPNASWDIQINPSQHALWYPNLSPGLYTLFSPIHNFGQNSQGQLKCVPPWWIVMSFFFKLLFSEVIIQSSAQKCQAWFCSRFILGQFLLVYLQVTQVQVYGGRHSRLIIYLTKLDLKYGTKCPQTDQCVDQSGII